MSKKNKDRIRRRRIKLWNKDPRCRNCGIITVLPVANKKIQDNTATIQHLYPKYHPLRGKRAHYTTLWCNKCNLADGHQWGEKVKILQYKSTNHYRYE